MDKNYVVEFSKFAAKQLARLPEHIKKAATIWKMSIESAGMLETRKSSGYHDEPLKGQRLGERSVRLSRAYRLIYIEFDDGSEIVVVGVQEVNKHDY